MKKDALRVTSARMRPAILAILGMSVVVNLLMLTGPIYMLQVYDRVISSRSLDTLIALTLIMLFAYLMMGLIDHARTRVATLVGARLQSDLDAVVMAETLRRTMEDPSNNGIQIAQRDLESVSRLMGMPVFLAIFDIPWIPIFLVATFLLHPALGILALVGGTVLAIIAVISAWANRDRQERAQVANIQSERMARELRRDADLIRGMGMGEGLVKKWRDAQRDSIVAWISHAESTGAFGNISKNLRQVLQSLILGAGALLVINDQMSPGGMIASSVLIGRALAPVDALIGNWSAVQKARKSWERLKALLGTPEAMVVKTRLPRPSGNIVLEQVTYGAAGKAIIRNISFDLKSGSGLGIIGNSGSGKTTLGRVIAGILNPQGGRVLLDGAAVNHYDAAEHGSWIGYLPQDVRLMNGTIEENISRFSSSASTQEVIRAAKLAGAHEMILDLPQGYQTPHNPEMPTLSGGQIQRIGLARALYATPPVIILDEPNSSLDNDGSEALNLAVQNMRALGSTVIMITHRPTALVGCDMLLVMDTGMMRAFGPKDRIMSEKIVQPQTAQTAGARN